MVNKAKIKGTKWETENVRFLTRWWPKQKRASLEGSGDVGDLTLPEGWAVECKDSPYAGNLPRFLREAEAEAGNKGVSRFVALVKNRRSKGESGRVPDGFAVTRTRVWADVAHEHEHATRCLDQIDALRARLSGDLPGRALTESAFVALVSETLWEYRYALALAQEGSEDA